VPLLPPGGGDSHIKRMVMLIRNIEKKLLRDTKILFCKCGLKLLSPERGTNSEIIQTQLITLKGSAKIPAVDLFLMIINKPLRIWIAEKS